MKIEREVNKHFQEFLLDNEQHIYFLLGGYGSSKSYNIALKIMLLSLKEKRKILVVRQVKENLKESCYADIQDIIYTYELERYFIFRNSPMKIVCTVTGTEILFRGLDNVKKIKSIKDIDTIWIEEADEIDYSSFKELKSRLRSIRNRNILMLSTNPNEYGVWTYKYLTEILGAINKDENDLYNERIIKIDNKIKLTTGKIYDEKIYLHHSVYKDNKFLPDNFIADLETEKDTFSRAVKTLGHFGSAGDRLFNNIQIMEQSRIDEIIKDKYNRFTGFDFGYSNSYNAIVRLVIDEELNDLYIWQEFYQNGITDVEMLETEIIKDLIKTGDGVYGDSAEPKTIAFYQINGLLINGAKKTADISKGGVKLLQSFRNIFIDNNVCPNTYRELTEMKWYLDKNGLIAKNPKTQKPFNFDPHSFDAIKYALCRYTPYIIDKHYYKKERI